MFDSKKIKKKIKKSFKDLHWKQKKVWIPSLIVLILFGSFLAGLGFGVIPLNTSDVESRMQGFYIQDTGDNWSYYADATVNTGALYYTTDGSMPNPETSQSTSLGMRSIYTNDKQWYFDVDQQYGGTPDLNIYWESDTRAVTADGDDADDFVVEKRDIPELDMTLFQTYVGVRVFLIFSADFDGNWEYDTWSFDHKITNFFSAEFDCDWSGSEKSGTSGAQRILGDFALGIHTENVKYSDDEIIEDYVLGETNVVAIHLLDKTESYIIVNWHYDDTKVSKKSQTTGLGVDTPTVMGAMGDLLFYETVSDCLNSRSALSGASIHDNYDEAWKSTVYVPITFDVLLEGSFGAWDNPSNEALANDLDYEEEYIVQLDFVLTILSVYGLDLIVDPDPDDPMGFFEELWDLISGQFKLWWNESRTNKIIISLVGIGFVLGVVLFVVVKVKGIGISSMITAAKGFIIPQTKQVKKKKTNWR